MNFEAIGNEDPSGETSPMLRMVPVVIAYNEASFAGIVNNAQHILRQSLDKIGVR